MSLVSAAGDEPGEPEWSPEIGALVRSIRYGDDLRLVLAHVTDDHRDVRLEVARWFSPTLPDPRDLRSARPTMPDDVAELLLADPDREVREAAIRRTSNLRALGAWAARYEELGGTVATGTGDDPRVVTDLSTAFAALRRLRQLIAEPDITGDVPAAWHDAVRDTAEPALMATYLSQPALHDDLRINGHLRELMAQPDLPARLRTDRSLSEPMRRALAAWATGSPLLAGTPEPPADRPEHLWHVEDVAEVLPFLQHPDPAMRLSAVSWFRSEATDPARVMPDAVLRELLAREDDEWIVAVALARCTSPEILLDIMDGGPAFAVAEAVRQLATLGLDAEVRRRADRLSDSERAVWYSATHDETVLAEALAAGAHDRELLGNGSLPADLLEQLVVSPGEQAHHPNAPDSLVRRSGVRLTDFRVGACPAAAAPSHAAIADRQESPAHRLGAAGADLGRLGWRGGDLAHVIECVLPTVESVLSSPDVTGTEVTDAARLIGEARRVTSVYRGPGALGQTSTHVEWRGELVRLRDHAERALPAHLVAVFSHELDHPREP